MKENYNGGVEGEIMEKNTVFGEESFIIPNMARMIETKTKQLEKNSLITRIAVDFLLDRDKVERWINLCINLDKIDKTDLIDIATKKRFADMENIINEQDEQIRELKQSQNQKAIEVLEKLKNNIWDLNIGDYYLQNGGLFENIKVKRAEVYELIDNQIKELRSEE